MKEKFSKFFAGLEAFVSTVWTKTLAIADTALDMIKAHIGEPKKILAGTILLLVAADFFLMGKMGHIDYAVSTLQKVLGFVTAVAAGNVTTLIVILLVLVYVEVKKK